MSLSLEAIGEDVLEPKYGTETLLSELKSNREYSKTEKNQILKNVETIFNIKREIKGIQNYLRGDRII